MKKGLSLFLAVILFGLFSTAALADSAPADVEAQKRVLSLGIMQGYGDEEGFGAERELTRAEFAAVVVRLLDMGEASVYENEPSLYIDVPEDFWAKSDITLVTRLGYMQGTGAGRFAPDDPVLFDQAVRVLVSVLGYSQAAAGMSGEGYAPYLAKASVIGLLKNAKPVSGTPIPRGQLAVLLDNALDIPLMVVSGGGGSEVSDATLLDRFLTDGAELTGIVEAIKETTLREDVKLEEDEVVISGYVYKTGSTNAKQLLGMQVGFYAKEIDGEAVLQGIYPRKNKNSELSLSGYDITKVTAGELAYTNDEDKEERIAVGSVGMVYNGRLYTGSMTDIFKTANASFRFLDNDGDGEYDWVFAEAYELAPVLKLRPEDGSITLKETLRSGLRSIVYDDKDKNVTILRRDGSPAEPEELGEEDLLLEIYSSSDGKNIKIVALADKVEGTLAELETADGNAVIDGAAYKFAKDAAGFLISLDSLKVGELYSFTLDSSNRIVLAEEVADAGDYRYGYIYKMSGESASGIDPDLQLKLIHGTKITNFEENRKFYIKGSDKQELVTLGVADRVRIDGAVYKDMKKARERLATVLNQSSDPDLKRGNVIRYKTNRDGKIDRLEILSPYGQYVSRSLNAEQMVMGGDDTPFGMDEETVVFFVPKSGAEDDISCEMKFGEASYYTQGFELDEDRPVVSAAIFQSTLSIFDNSDFGADEKTKIVQQVSEEADAEGNLVYRISGYGGSEIFNKVTRADAGQVTEVAASLRRGDVIQFSVDFDGQINRIKKLVSIPTNQEYFHTGEQTASEIIFGIAVSTDREYLGIGATEYQNQIGIALNSDGSEVTNFQMPVKKTKAPDIYIYDRARDKVTAADFDDVMAMDMVGEAEASRVVLYASDSTVKAIVILK